MLVYYTRIGGSQSADFYLVIDGISCVIMSCVKAKSADIIANSYEALECSKLVYSLRS